MNAGTSTYRLSGAIARAWGLLTERGVADTASILWRILRGRVVAAYRRTLLNRQVVFRRGSGAQALMPATPGLEIRRFCDLQAMPEWVKSELVAWRGSAFVSTLQKEIERGAVLWTGHLDGHIVGTRMSRAGRHFPRWYLPLAADDIVIFGGATMPEYRGRRIAPTMIDRICTEMLGPGAAAYVDCKVWNKSSIRSIEHAGFQRVGVMKPLEWEDVFG